LVADPTATQDDAVAHEIPLSAVDTAPFGLGVSTRVHAQPFHRSAKAQELTALSVYDPTARHCDGLEQDTAFRALDAAPGTPAVGITDHVTPFHTSLSALTTSLAL
jgi:hypothetical protein